MGIDTDTLFGNSVYVFTRMAFLPWLIPCVIAQVYVETWYDVYRP